MLKKRKISPSKEQKIIDKAFKSGDISENNISGIARSLNYDIGKKQLSFLADVAKIKSNSKKIILPERLCKNGFNLIYFTNFGKQNNKMSLITNDKIYWNLYFSNLVMNNKKLAYFNYGNHYPMVDNISFINDDMYESGYLSGYSQDFEENITCIVGSNGKLTKEQINVFLKGENNVMLFDGNYLDKLYVANMGNDLLLCYPKKMETENLYRIYKNTRCINSKNKLADGLKEVKTGAESLYYFYMNIKLTNFVPSCLFFKNYISNYEILFKGTIEVNDVFNFMSKSLSSTLTNTFSLIEFPENFIFWNNIDSLVEILDIMIIIININEKLKSDIMKFLRLYNENKDYIEKWRYVYRDFEKIVKTFYDSVTLKVNVDKILSLREKITYYIENLKILNRKEYYDKGIIFFSYLNNCSKLIVTFITSDVKLEVVKAIQKIINMLVNYDTESSSKIEDLIRTTGIMCFNCFMNGSYSMIPEIRSRFAFAGNLFGELKKDVVEASVKVLLEQIVDKRKEKESKKYKTVNLSERYEKINEIVDQVLSNTLDRSTDNAIVSNKEVLIDFIKRDSAIMDSLREDVDLWMDSIDYDEEDIKKNMDFLNNVELMSFFGILLAYDKLLKEKNLNVSSDDIFDSIRIKKKLKFIRDADQKKRYKDAMLRKKKKLTQNEMNNVISNAPIVNYKKLYKSVPEFQNLFNSEQEFVDTFEKYKNNALANLYGNLFEKK
jgi:hypothetical protein